MPYIIAAPADLSQTGGEVVFFNRPFWANQIQFSISTDTDGEIVSAAAQFLGDGPSNVTFGFDNFTRNIAVFNLEDEGMGRWRIREVAPVPLPASGLLLLAGILGIRRFSLA